MNNTMQAVQSIYKYTSDIHHADTLWINFNTRYNRILKLSMIEEQFETRVSSVPIPMSMEETDQKARYTFEKWIKKTFPHISYEPVLDKMPAYHMSWPYLGSFAINVLVGSDEYKAIRHRYETKKGDNKNINACLYIMKYEDALVTYNFYKGLKEVWHGYGTELCPNK